MMISAEDIRVEKHIIGTTASDIRDFSAPLRHQFNIDHFSYVKLWPGNKESHLTTHPDLAEVFYKERLYESAGVGEPSEYKQCNLLGDHCQHELIIRAAKEHRIHHIFYLVRPGPGFCEIFVFGTSIQNPLINNFYINNLDLLEAFTCYFKESANNLTQQADNNIVTFPGVCEDSLILSHIDDISEVTNHDLHAKNLVDKASFRPNRLLAYSGVHSAFPSSKIALSMREQQCSYFLLEGLTAKEIANTLNISPRTVEVYFERLKKRLDCKNKAQLIKRLAEYNLNHAFNKAFQGGQE